MKICFIYRKKNKNGQSIENVFNTVTEELNENNSIEIIYYDNNIFLFIINILKTNAQIIHITGDINFLSIFTRILNKKTILTIHDIGHFKNLKGLKKIVYFIFWIQLPILFSNIVTSISKYTINDIDKILLFKKNKIKLVYNPLQKNFKFFPKLFNYTKPIILIVGTAIHKNIEVTINAVKGLNCELLIIGKLSNFQKVQLRTAGIKYINKYNLNDEELLNCYKSSDILSFQSKHEGFGLPIIEAQAVGRLVLCSKYCSIPEIASNGAIYCNADDINDIKEKLNFIFDSQNKHFIDKLIQNGLINVKNFNSKIIANNYLSFYHNLLSN